MRTLTAEFLQLGLTDIIQLSEMAGVARRRGVTEVNSVRAEVLAALSEMLQSGWIVLGDAVKEEGVIGVRPWDISPEAAVDRVRREWEALAQLRPGDVCWFELTTTGKQAARGLQQSTE